MIPPVPSARCLVLNISHVYGAPTASSPAPPMPVRKRMAVNQTTFDPIPPSEVVNPYSRIDAPSVSLRPYLSAATPKPIVPSV